MIPKLRNCQNLRKATGNICDRLWHLSRCGQNVNFPNGTTSLKTTQMLHKNKACSINCTICFADTFDLSSILNVTSGEDQAFLSSFGGSLDAAREACSHEHNVPETATVTKIAYAIWVWSIFLTFPGTYSMQPAVTSQTFGHRYGRGIPA